MQSATSKREPGSDLTTKRLPVDVQCISNYLVVGGRHGIGGIGGRVPRGHHEDQSGSYGLTDGLVLGVVVGLRSLEFPLSESLYTAASCQESLLALIYSRSVP